MKFTIESVSKMTGIPSSSLRNWEKRYGFPQPERTGGGHRYYSATDVEFLKRVAHWLDEGQCLNEIARLYQLRCQEASVVSHSQEAISMVAAVTDDVTYRTELLYEALLNFDQSAIQQHYAILNAKLSHGQLCDRVFEKIFFRVKEDRAAGRITIGQDRFAVAFIRVKLSSFLAIDFPSNQGPPVLLAAIEEERQEGALLIMAVHLKFHGFPVLYFGAGLSIEGLRNLVADLKPTAVCLSYVDPTHLHRDLKSLKDIDVPFCIGGLIIFNHSAMEELSPLAPENVHFCQRASGSEAAEYIEMICQCHPKLK
jgi:DNA-binding transcriptional MerR regulator